MNYQIDQFAYFDVIPGNPEDDFFHLMADGPEGRREVQLKKLDFQKDPRRPQISRLQCRIKGFDADGLPVLGHAIAPYVYELYYNIYAHGETFECMVYYVPQNPAEEPYSVRDRYGIFYRLYEPEAMLSKGQPVRCKFKLVTPTRFEMHMVNEMAQLPFLSPEELFNMAGVAPRERGFIMNSIFTLPEFSAVVAEISRRRPQWPLTAARVVRRHLSEWYLHARLWRHNNLHKKLLAALEATVLFLLEGSNYLNGMRRQHRLSIQKQLTELVEALEPYNVTLGLIGDKQQDSFVESLFDKLQKSGYLYHPARQFGSLMLIFREYPDKVSSYLNRIFESIFSRELENWKLEPFRSAFVEQFEIYVRQARRDIDNLPLAEDRVQKSGLETIITALALQLLLASPEEDTSRTLSLFYRYISLLRPLNSEGLLSKSFLALMGCDMPERLLYSQLREPMMMMTRATVMPEGNLLDRLKNRHRYSNGLVEFTVSNAGLNLSRVADRIACDSGIAEHVIPEGFMPWLRPQIHLRGIRSLTGTKQRRLAEHDRWWQQIESGLFEDSVVKTEEPVDIRAAKIDDEVYIVVDSVMNAHDTDPIFCVHIQHEGIEESRGFLRRSDIVNYNLKQPGERSYTAPDGSRLGFLATVKGIGSDGNYEFSLRALVDAHINQLFNYSDEYLAVVTGSNPQGYSGISRDGIGLYLIDDEGGRTFRPGDIVHFRLRSGNAQGNIFGYITSGSDDENDHFDKISAFERLMHAIGESENDAEGDDIITDLDEELTPDDIRELIEILRFHAIADSDLINAYDYLCYARLLALTIGDDRFAAKLATHAALLGQHQYFAANNRVDAEALERLRDLTSDDPLLRMIYHRLEMVSWLGDNTHNESLFATASHPTNELEGSIARMVLSYNMMNDSDSDDNSIASGLKSRIMKKLNINSETRRGKYYGSESKYLEFKTSIVFPAASPGQEMRENPAEQQMHILSRIAGMLNASGGRLYLGVNNDGYAVGLHDDFSYFARHKARLGNRSFDIRDTDNLCVFLENLIHDNFGATVARKIEISVDDEAEKPVILFTIAESLEPVFLDGHLYVRQSGQSTREYHGADIEDFKAERAQQRAERARQEAIAAETVTEEVMEAGLRTAEPEEEIRQEYVPEAAGNDCSETANVNKVSTSRWRPNVLHNFEDGFNDPYGYLYFTGENTLEFSRTDKYMEHDPDCRLALAVPHEMKDDYLVLGYEDQRAVRIPLAEIYEKGENNEVSHNGDFRLEFAAIAKKDDLLACVLVDNSDTMWRRALPIAQVENGHLGTQPEKVHTTTVNRVEMWDIVDASAASAFSDCIADRLNRKQPGMTMRAKITDERAADKLNEFTNMCRPANS